jgi:REP element-mobilizing transposase RayT
LTGFDYSTQTAVCLLTIDTHQARPVLGDTALAKRIASALLAEQELGRLRLLVYTILPDHVHVLAGTGRTGKTISHSMDAFKSITTQIYWSRSKEVVDNGVLCLPSECVEKGSSAQDKQLLAALREWRAALRPEVVQLEKWPRVKTQHFLSKQLWHRSFHDHVIRNEQDLRETLEYVLLNPVKRGYVPKPEYYPFTGFGLIDS